MVRTMALIFLLAAAQCGQEATQAGPCPDAAPPAECYCDPASGRCSVCLHDCNYASGWDLLPLGQECP
jgi:hypothetical protein